MRLCYCPIALCVFPLSKTIRRPLSKLILPLFVVLLLLLRVHHEHQTFPFLLGCWDLLSYTPLPYILNHDMSAIPRPIKALQNNKHQTGFPVLILWSLSLHVPTARLIPSTTPRRSTTVVAP
jgi:hypothetical protein